VESQEHFIALGAMLVVALAISHLATGLRRETDLARLNEQRARQLQALATELANAARTSRCWRWAAPRSKPVLPGRACWP
jgi:K+-sensing histidine kinase KdpD